MKSPAHTVCQCRNVRPREARVCERVIDLSSICRAHHSWVGSFVVHCRPGVRVGLDFYASASQPLIYSIPGYHLLTSSYLTDFLEGFCSSPHDDPWHSSGTPATLVVSLAIFQWQRCTHEFKMEVLARPPATGRDANTGLPNEHTNAKILHKQHDSPQQHRSYE
jgi:hypothetical protein